MKSKTIIITYFLFALLLSLFGCKPPTCYFSLKNVDSTVSKDSIFVCIVGKNPADRFHYSYLDFETGQLRKFTGYKSNVTSMPLSQLPDSIPVPAIQSARLYVAVGKDFDSTEFAAGSGPSMSQVKNGGANNIFDFIEFDTHAEGSYNINSTNVDMYAITYTMQLTDQNGQQVTRGLTGNRQTMYNAFKSIPASDTTAWYSQLFVTDKQGNYLRFLAPQQTAYADFSDTGAARQMDNYFNHYLKNEVFSPGRKFLFYDKLYPSSINVDTGSVNKSGDTLTVKTSNGNTFSIGLPINPGINLAENWHNVAGQASTIDWGFVIWANALVSTLPGAWASDSAQNALLSLTISICRGVASLNKPDDWIHSSNYFGAAPGGFTEYYGKIIHQYAFDGLAYAYSYDDVYSKNSSVYFNKGTNIHINFTSIGSVNSSHP
ncbi:beta-1,3-glucanase family protein [Chitinophaga sancti]|uniref:beta-1,3-glucanase family protein n=1 Tax=Chitinophaga sancti TaxID=1004 RepID=UPI003F79B239